MNIGENALISSRALALSTIMLLAATAPVSAATRGWQPGESSVKEARHRIAVGGSHACAALYDGTVRCWGSNDFGELGNGTVGQASSSPVTVRVRLGLTTRVLTGVVAVSASANELSCALLVDGRVFCWGKTLVSGGAVAQPLATPIFGISDAVQIADTTNGACALLASGVVKCFLFTDDTIANSVVTVGGIPPGIDLAAGASFQCILAVDGGIRCVGTDSQGELGNGSNNGSNVVNSIAGASAIAAGSTSACALGPEGRVRCWGANPRGELGIGNTVSQTEPTLDVIGLTGAVSVSGSRNHYCAITAQGRVRCWGRNTFGQLGDGTELDRSNAVEVLGVTNAIAVSAGTTASCAMLADGSVTCWGTPLRGFSLAPSPAASAPSPLPPAITPARSAATARYPAGARTAPTAKSWATAPDPPWCRTLRR